MLKSRYLFRNTPYYKQNYSISFRISGLLAKYIIYTLETKMFSTYQIKPHIGIEYVVDTFIYLQFSFKEFKIFRNHLISKDKNIKFTIETGYNKILASLDIKLTRTK